MHGAGRLAVVSALVVYLFGGVSSDVLFWTAIPGVVVSVIGAIPYGVALRRSFPQLGRDLIQFNCCVCPDCGYILRGEHHDPLDCSECGGSYSRAELKDIWKPLLSSLRARFPGILGRDSA